MAKAIRDGCYVKWKTPNNKILEGEVIGNHYFKDIHYFTVKLTTGQYHHTTGFVLYRGMIEHIVGYYSKKETKKWNKRYKRQKNQTHRQRERQRKPRRKNSLKQKSTTRDRFNQKEQECIKY